MVLLRAAIRIMLLHAAVCVAFFMAQADSFSSHASRSATRHHTTQETRLYTLDRRAWLATTVLSFPAMAAVAEQPKSSDILWLTGKEPLIPGKKPRDKNDVSGTRRDPNFLRSLADCKNQCENSVMGPDGLAAKTKEECLSDCQDICCRTYQQCTFAIVPRI